MHTKFYEKVKNFIILNYKFFIVLCCTIFVLEYELPYKIYTPGGMVNLEDRIKIEGEYKAEGKLGMAYVSVVRGSIPFLALSKIIPNWKIVANKDVTYPNETMEEALKKDKLKMAESVNNATITAYRLAGKEIKITKEINHITYIADEADTTLKIFDEIVSVDGSKIDNIDDLKRIIENKEIGEEVNILVLRDGVSTNTVSKIYDTEYGKKIGIAFTKIYEYEENPKLKVSTKSSESGPSGGLMMSLAIYNKLVEEDITKGKKIIGTGTIDEIGNVGEIGGVEYKLLGAVKQKCDVFLVPKENYAEAIRIKKKKNLNIEIIKVKTIEEALMALEKL